MAPTEDDEDGEASASASAVSAAAETSFELGSACGGGRGSGAGSAAVVFAQKPTMPSGRTPRATAGCIMHTPLQHAASASHCECDGWHAGQRSSGGGGQDEDARGSGGAANA
jgi:hypothetical protein